MRKRSFIGVLLAIGVLVFGGGRTCLGEEKEQGGGERGGGRENPVGRRARRATAANAIVHRSFDDWKPPGKGTECFMCSKNMSSIAALKVHLLRHTGIKPHSCALCNMTFFQRGGLRQHELTHRQDNDSKPYRCKQCARSFREKTSLINHQRLHTGERPYQCPQCHKSFVQKNSLSVHLRAMHNNTGKIFKCQVCEKIFYDKSNYRRHEITRHESGAERITDPDSGKKKIKCRECGKILSGLYAFKTHARLHTGVMPYKCKNCTACFKQQTSLINHVARFHLPKLPFACPNCSKSFSLRQNLRQHMKVHGKSEWFKCSNCSRAFTQKSNLHAHQIVHTGIFAYKCPRCEKRYKSRRALRFHLDGSHFFNTTRLRCFRCNKRFGTREQRMYHILVHHPNSNSNSKCSICGFQTSNKLRLRQHMLLHERTVSRMSQFYPTNMLSCTLCDFNSTNPVLFTAHTSKHTKESKTSNLSKRPFFRSPRSKSFPAEVSTPPSFECRECGNFYSNIQSLQRHQTTHGFDLRFTCTLCPKVFSYASSRSNHLRNFHFSSGNGMNCSLCGKEFKTRFSKDRHMYLKHPEFPSSVYKCKKCQTFYSTKDGLHRHESTCGEEKPIQCTVCRKGLQSTSALKRHMIFLHLDILTEKVGHQSLEAMMAYTESVVEVKPLK
ncbi:hypothetical protein AAMO2058_000594100 [Amorphochlora amoebiformis]